MFGIYRVHGTVTVAVLEGVKGVLSEGKRPTRSGEEAGVKPGSKPGTAPEAKAKDQPETRAGGRPDARPESKADTGPDDASATKASTEPDDAAVTKARSERVLQADTLILRADTLILQGSAAGSGEGRRSGGDSKDVCLMFRKGRLNLGGLTLECGPEGWRWDGKPRPPSRRPVETLGTPAVQVKPSQEFSFFLGSAHLGIQYFERRPDGLFELKTLEKPDSQVGVQLSGMVEKAGGTKVRRGLRRTGKAGRRGYTGCRRTWAPKNPVVA